MLQTRHEILSLKKKLVVECCINIVTISKIFSEKSYIREELKVDYWCLEAYEDVQTGHTMRLNSMRQIFSWNELYADLYM